MNQLPSPSDFGAADFAAAERFLVALDPSASAFTFQTFADTKRGKGPVLTRIRHGALCDHFAELSTSNVQGAGVFVTANETDLRGRKTANIARVRAIWQEDDKGRGAPGDGFPAPHIVVESSPGKYHRYWLVDDVTLEQHPALMRMMAQRFGSDPNACDLARVLRLPGFYHRKGDPHLCRLVSIADDLTPLKYDAFKRWLPEAAPSKPTLAPPAPSGDFDTREIMGLLSRISAKERDIWLRVGMALHHEAGGSDEGFELWDIWSRTALDNYVSEHQRPTWDGFRLDRGVTIGTLRHMARQSCDADAGFEVLTEGDPQPSATSAPNLASQIKPLRLNIDDLASLPPRPWIVSRKIIRRALTVLIAPGSAGKSTLTLQWAMALAMGDGRFIGLDVREPCRVLLVNLEDDADEIKRRAEAAALAFGIPGEALGNRLHIFDSHDCGMSLLAKPGRETLAETALMAELRQQVAREKYDVVILDPLVEFHDADENSNSEMKRVASALKRLARACDAAVLLVHHTKKPNGTGSEGLAGNADAARGASALINASRIALTLVPASSGDVNVPADQRHRYVRLDDAKMNLSLASTKAEWFEKVSVPLPNGDTVGTLKPAKFDSAGGEPTSEQLDAVLAEIERITDDGTWQKWSTRSERSDQYLPRALSDDTLFWMNEKEILSALSALELAGKIERAPHGRPNRNSGVPPLRWRARQSDGCAASCSAQPAQLCAGSRKAAQSPNSLGI